MSSTPSKKSKKVQDTWTKWAKKVKQLSSHMTGNPERRKVSQLEKGKCDMKVRINKRNKEQVRHCFPGKARSEVGAAQSSRSWSMATVMRWLCVGDQEDQSSGLEFETRVFGFCEPHIAN